MYCLECDFPQCTKCKERATVCVYQKQQHGKEEPYMCDKCLYPPCPKCGKERPRQKEYKSTTIITWTCKSCRYGTEGKGSPTLRYFKTNNLKIYFLIRTSCFGYRSKQVDAASAVGKMLLSVTLRVRTKNDPPLPVHFIVSRSSRI